MTIPQRINFIRKLEEENGATISFSNKKTILNFLLDSLIVI